MKRLTLVLEISATFLRQRGNGAVAQDGTNVSFIQIFMCTFCLLQLYSLVLQTLLLSSSETCVKRDKCVNVRPLVYKMQV